MNSNPLNSAPPLAPSVFGVLSSASSLLVDIEGMVDRLGALPSELHGRVNGNVIPENKSPPSSGAIEHLCDLNSRLNVVLRRLSDIDSEMRAALGVAK